MAPFDAVAILADLHSPEAALLEGSIIVVGASDELLSDLYDTFVFQN